MIKCSSEDHGRLKPSSLDLELHILPLGHCLLPEEACSKLRHQIEVNTDCFREGAAGLE